MPPARPSAVTATSLAAGPFGIPPQRAKGRRISPLLLLALVMAVVIGAVVVHTHSGGGSSPTKSTSVVRIDPSATTTWPNPIRLTDQSPACMRRLRDLGPPASRKFGSDPQILLQYQPNLAPAPGVPGFANATVTGLSIYKSAKDFVDHSPEAVDRATWLRILDEDGFGTAYGEGWKLGDGAYGAEALQFGSPGQADDFNRRTLALTCAHGAIDDMQRIPGFSNAVTFVRTDGFARYRAVFVVDDWVVRLNICSCATVANPMDVVRNWATAYALTLGSARPLTK